MAAKDRNSEHRSEVLHEYDAWAKLNPKDSQTMNGMMFFTYLQKEKPQLLDFRATGDKWQTVHAWLLRAGRVKS